MILMWNIRDEGWVQLRKQKLREISFPSRPLSCTDTHNMWNFIKHTKWLTSCTIVTVYYCESRVFQGHFTGNCYTGFSIFRSRNWFKVVLFCFVALVVDGWFYYRLCGLLVVDFAVSIGFSLSLGFYFFIFLPIFRPMNWAKSYGGHGGE